MPTVFPKCSPSELMGLLVLLNDHRGAEDVARLADDLDLEIDEILPAVEFSELLLLVTVKDGRATLTDLGKKLLGATIRERKSVLREQLKRTALFKALVRALENAPERKLTEDQLVGLLDFTTAPADDYVQNIINWGRYTELFRYDSDRRVLVMPRTRSGGRATTPGTPPATGRGAPAGPTDPPSAAVASGAAHEKLSSRSLAIA